MRNRRGVTLIELAIGVTLLSALFLTVYSVLASSSSTYATNSSLAANQERGRRVVDEIAKELRMADRDALAISTFNGASRVDFAVVTGYADGAPTWSSQIQLQYEPSTVDANENGVADEGKIVRVQNGESITLCDYVKAGGFQVQRTGNNLVIRLELIGTDGKSRELETWVETSVTFRNGSS